MRSPLEQYHRIIGPFRKVARENGYAITVHGSLERDIDLVAIPWVDGAISAPLLAELLISTAKEITGLAALGFRLDKDAQFAFDGCPGDKPHGRLGWSFTLGGGSYVDLSVIPPITKDAP